MNKKILWVIGGMFGLIYFFAGLEYCKADVNFKQPNEYVSQGVYQSSCNFQAQLSTTVTTDRSILHTININLPGATGSRVEIFNGQVSSMTATRIATIDGSSKMSFTYDVFCSSAIFWNITSPGSLPDVTATYLPGR